MGSQNHPLTTPTDYMKLFFIPESLGFVIGLFIIWRVFPQGYLPTTYEEFYPQPNWVRRCLIGLGLATLLIHFGIVPLEFVPSRMLDDIWQMPVWALMTYALFFFILGHNVQKQTNDSNSLRSIQNQEPPLPLRHVVIRSAILSTLVFSGVFIASVVGYFHIGHPAELRFFTEAVFIPEILGFFMGIFIIWRTFSQSSVPISLKKSFPKIYWGLCFWVGLAFLINLAGLLTPPHVFDHAPFLIGLGIIPVMAFLTYIFFYSEMWYRVPFKQFRK